ncbi:MAG: hypothetical protein AAF747_06240 [Planctomycetota bacterium]
MQFHGITVAAVAVSTSFASAQLVNVALNAPVSVAAGSTGNASLSTLTDGLFLGRSTTFSAGVTWTDAATIIEIDLGSAQTLVGGIVEADDNDAYELLGRNLTTGAFETIWDIPNFDNFGSGFQTRPNPEDVSEVFFFAAPLTTDTIRIRSTSGDFARALGEVQVFVPAAPGVAVLSAGLGFAARRRR